MKKFLSVFLVASMASGLFCSAFAGDRKVSQGRIENLVSSLREEASRAGSSEDDESVSLPGLKVSSKGGVDFVSIGKIWTRSLGLAALTGGDDDEDVRAVAGMMKSLRKLLVVSYEDCEVSLKEKFDRKISSALDGCELLAQMKDDDDSVSIYGNTSRDGKSIDDIVMYCPQSSALICFFGTLDADRLGDLIDKAAKD